jgi:hypothetical protein
MLSLDDRLSTPPSNDPAPDGAQVLLIHVISQAIADHGARAWRDEVDAFFCGPAFARYCALLGWNEDWARHRIQRYVSSPRRNRPTHGEEAI